MQQRSHELVMVEGPVELHGEAIGDCSVVYVKPRGLTYVGKGIAAGVWLGFGGLVVDGVGVDKGDLEAT